MGMDRSIAFTQEIPDWPRVAGLLAGAGYPLQMRMIDNELSFPDEEPPATWREIRVAAHGAMVTVRRGIREVVLTTWGNAAGNQRELFDALAWAFACAGGGRVRTEQGEVSAEEFAKAAELPASRERAE